MIAVSFLEALARDDGTAAIADPQRTGEVASLATKYVDAALAEWERVLECERQFGSIRFPTPAEQSKVNRSLYEVYQKWSDEAEQVLLRTRRLTQTGYAVENAEALEHAFGRVQARLKMTPELFDRAREQIRQGQGIPMEGLRDGLRARVRT
jgi:hypothetical protein